jgi:uncharacterized protein with HEPN domain
MRPEIKSLLFDMQHAAIGIQLFVAGKTLEDLCGDLMLQSAVERQFEIIGEAMTRLRKIDPAFIERISDHQRIIGFRNALIHGYDAVDQKITWRIIQDKLPVLQRELEQLLDTG